MQTDIASHLSLGCYLQRTAEEDKQFLYQIIPVYVVSFPGRSDTVPIIPGLFLLVLMVAFLQEPDPLPVKNISEYPAFFLAAQLPITCSIMKPLGMNNHMF